jgi:hypothetical protein
MRWKSSEELLKELRDLGQYRDEMDGNLQAVLDELIAAAEASSRQKLPMVFSQSLIAVDSEGLQCCA